MANIDPKIDEQLAEIESALLKKIAYKVDSGYLVDAAAGMLTLLRLTAMRAVRNGGTVRTRGEDIEVTQQRPSDG